MAKELSKQLCELCGMEPKYYFYDLRHKEFIEIIHKTYLKLKNEYQTKEVYPDFSKPENFVKLFNLTLPIKGIPTIAEFVTYEHLIIKDSTDFLEKLIYCLKGDSYVNDVKQAIREAEWVYD